MLYINLFVILLKSNENENENETATTYFTILNSDFLRR